MNVLVTGGRGFIGARLVSGLCEIGCHVKVLSRKRKNTISLGNGTVEYLECDLLDTGPFNDSCLEGCSVVFNCAGELHDEKLMRPLHVESVKRLVAACKRVAKDTGENIHWVQLSSVGAYGPPSGSANTVRIITEDTKPTPVGSYEVTKIEADKLVIAAAENNIFSYSILRPSNVYGADMPNSSLRQWASLIKKKLFFFVGKPGAISTYIHVDDVVSALLLCGFDQRSRGEIFNLSNDCTQEQLVSAMAKALNVSAPWLRLPEWLVRFVSKLFSSIKIFPVTGSRINSLVARTQYPTLKLKRFFGYVPAHNVVDTVEEVLRGMERK